MKVIVTMPTSMNVIVFTLLSQDPTQRSSQNDCAFCYDDRQDFLYDPLSAMMDESISYIQSPFEIGFIFFIGTILVHQRDDLGIKDFFAYISLFTSHNAHTCYGDQFVLLYLDFSLARTVGQFSIFALSDFGQLKRTAHSLQI